MVSQNKNMDQQLTTPSSRPAWQDIPTSESGVIFGGMTF